MRLLVFFDLPTTSAAAKRAYVLFRRFLLKDGYDMLQWSVYGRVVNGFDDMETHLNRLNMNLPPEGSVRCLTVSEKQFAAMKLLVGPPRKQEKKVSAQQLVLL
ncbi:CRISPR-associated endonuclease Cas2 [Marinospirillum sp. MEB164]|uniref:CRISPR-associated endoribonuclease Cas2 n=1 Tax=Marinospirillum alkalitolerans TaxID=3123374 RepID=A0ABW8Q102_9GAMM